MKKAKLIWSATNKIFTNFKSNNKLYIYTDTN